VESLVETLSRRHIGVVGEEFAVSKDGMEMFGVMELRWMPIRDRKALITRRLSRCLRARPMRPRLDFTLLRWLLQFARYCRMQR
jgi:hypothetical protein